MATTVHVRGQPDLGQILRWGSEVRKLFKREPELPTHFLRSFSS